MLNMHFRIRFRVGLEPYKPRTGEVLCYSVIWRRINYSPLQFQHDYLHTDDTDCGPVRSDSREKTRLPEIRKNKRHIQAVWTDFYVFTFPEAATSRC